MVFEALQIVYEDKKFKIKILEKIIAFVIFVPLGQTFF